MILLPEAVETMEYDNLLGGTQRHVLSSPTRDGTCKHMGGVGRKGAVEVYFRVTKIIDADTFEVLPLWTFGRQRGNRVRPTGYNAPEIGMPGHRETTEFLRQLILGRVVDLRNAATVDRGRVVCDVFVNGKDLSSYFWRYRN